MAIFIANVLYKKKLKSSPKSSGVSEIFPIDTKTGLITTTERACSLILIKYSPKGLQLQQQVTPCTETDATLSIDVHEKQSTSEPCHFKQLNKIDLTWTHDL